MSLVKRRGAGAAVMLLVGAAAVTALVMASGERPVDVRLVAPKPAQQDTVSASMTTTVPAVAAQTTTTTQVPVVAPVITTTQPAAPPRATTSGTKSGLTDLIGELCDYVYRDSKGKVQCLPLVLDPGDPCKWLEQHGIKQVEVRGRDKHSLDLDLDGFICG